MRNKKWIILENGKHQLVGNFMSHKTAQEVCDYLNAKKKGKQTIYLAKYSVVEAKEVGADVFKADNWK